MDNRIDNWREEDFKEPPASTQIKDDPWALPSALKAPDDESPANSKYPQLFIPKVDRIRPYAASESDPLTETPTDENGKADVTFQSSGFQLSDGVKDALNVPLQSESTGSNGAPDNFIS